MVIALRQEIESIPSSGIFSLPFHSRFCFFLKIALQSQLRELRRESKTPTEKVEYLEALEKELTQAQATADEILKNARLERLEKDQEILALESQNDALRAEVSVLKAAPASGEADQSSIELKRLQAKLEKIMQLYEDLKQNGLTELNELRKKYDDRVTTDPQSRARSSSIEGLPLSELQQKYDELKGKHDAQLATLRGTTLEKVQSKRNRILPTSVLRPHPPPSLISSSHLQPPPSSKRQRRCRRPRPP